MPEPLPVLCQVCGERPAVLVDQQQLSVCRLCAVVMSDEASHLADYLLQRDKAMTEEPPTVEPIE